MRTACHIQKLDSTVGVIRKQHQIPAFVRTLKRKRELPWEIAISSHLKTSSRLQRHFSDSQ